MRPWITLLAFLIVSIDTQAAPSQPGTTAQSEAPAEVQDVKIGSTIQFGTTYVGSELTRSFRVINKDATRTMIITNFNMDAGNPNSNPWIVMRRPPSSIPPGKEGFFTVTLLGTQVGVYTAGFYWNADTDPPSQEDTFFTFDVKGEVLSKPKE
jgi:hypothetical protein